MAVSLCQEKKMVCNLFCKKKKSTKKALLYFRFTIYKLNLVVNNLSLVPEIRNTTTTTHYTFLSWIFFRRNYVPNISAFRETQYSCNYKTR